jgi:single-stranded-DNA-specific exonuclease
VGSGGHVSLRAAGADGGSLGAIAFRALEGPLGPLLLNAGERPVHLAGHLRLNHWQGTVRPQFHIRDAAPAE